MEKIEIGIGHVIQAMRRYGFGYAEISALREAMLTDDFSKLSFVDDCYSEEWPDAKFKRLKLDARDLESKMPLSVEVDEGTLKLLDGIVERENKQSIVDERRDRTMLIDYLVEGYADKMAKIAETIDDL